MSKVELLLPAGNIDSLRAAVANGADAVYLGLTKFNARISAENFNESNITGVIDFAHKHNVKVYVVLNTLIKNNELEDFLNYLNIILQAKADAVIIQDSFLIPLIKEYFPHLKIHLSTQSTITNSFAVPKGIDRVILPRELSIDEISIISKKFETEIFVHGALCFCYSGLCLFSSIVGGRSGNRGRCAQPCRLIYNDKHALSTMDLCTLKRIPDIINSGVSSLKVEGRLRNPFYVATVARIYRKYIDLYYSLKKSNSLSNFVVEEADLDQLKLAFNRRFTEGFGFKDSITESTSSSHRGLFLGNMENGLVKLNAPLSVGDTIKLGLSNSEVVDVISIKINKSFVDTANKGDVVKINELDLNSEIYKLKERNSSVDLGDEIVIKEHVIKTSKFNLDNFLKIKPISSLQKPKLFVKVYDVKSALDAEKYGADVIYYDIFKDDFLALKASLKSSLLFASTPRILSDTELMQIKEKIDLFKPAGVLVGNKGLYNLLSSSKSFSKDNLHLDYSFNIFNDIDLASVNALPIISPELSFEEISAFKNKDFIVFVHGDMILMTAKQKMKAKELMDKDNRRFRVRYNFNMTEILNCKQLGLFNFVKNLNKVGVNFFFIDLEQNVGKYVKIYKAILSDYSFDDSKIRKPFTKGHFDRGVL